MSWGFDFSSLTIESFILWWLSVAIITLFFTYGSLYFLAVCNTQIFCKLSFIESMVLIFTIIFITLLSISLVGNFLTTTPLSLFRRIG